MTRYIGREMHIGPIDRAAQSARWHAINSAMAGIANAIELCEAAKLPALSHRLLEIQRDALRERERP